MMVRLALASFEDVLAHELAFKDDGIPTTGMTFALGGPIST